MAAGADDNFIRSLARLYESRSTSRVLNIARLHADLAAAGQAIDAPIFANRALNKSIITKHRLRPGEDQAFLDRRAGATKIMILIDVNNLKAGAKYVMIDQRNWQGVLANEAFVDPERDQRDLRILRLLDQTPSFDPFLLREWFARDGLEVDPRYFDLTQPLIDAMEGFVAREISRLVSIAFGGAASPAAVGQLVRKMLGSQYDADLDPFRETLKLTEAEFHESMFAWKGFLYYKWQMSALGGQIAALNDEFEAMTPRYGVPPAQMRTLQALTQALRPAVIVARRQAADLLAQYDAAYGAITQRGSPAEFRQFLFEAPVHFMTLGHVMGVLSHICQYWRFRAGPVRSGLRIPPDELQIMLEEFRADLDLEARMMFA